jgi:SAM-dependent methyltransferase
MINDRTIEYYQKRAAEYEKIYFRDIPDRQAELAELYQLSAQTLAGKTVLDLACGTGFWAKFLTEQTRYMAGLDINVATLIEAGKKTYPGMFDFVLADITLLPFLIGSFDAALVTFLLSHVKRQEISQLGDQLRSAIRPGSKVFLCDNNLICELVPDVYWDDEHINSYVKRQLENGEEFHILKNYFDKKEVASVLEGWGRIEKLIYKRYYWGVVLTIV